MLTASSILVATLLMSLFWTGICPWPGPAKHHLLARLPRGCCPRLWVAAPVARPSDPLVIALSASICPDSAPLSSCSGGLIGPEGRGLIPVNTKKVLLLVIIKKLSMAACPKHYIALHYSPSMPWCHLSTNPSPKSAWPSVHTFPSGLLAPPTLRQLMQKAHLCY